MRDARASGKGDAMAGSLYEGKTFDEAVRKGLDALKLTRAEAVITTVEEGKSGFLGIGSRPFRVSVARRPGGAIREPSERTGESRGSRRGGREERGGDRAGARGTRRGSGERAREAQAGGRAGGEERGAGSRGRAGRDRDRDRPAAAGHGRRGAEEPAADPRPRREPREPRAGARGGRAESQPAGEERAERAERAERPDRPRRGGDRPQHARREEPAREARPPRDSMAPQAAEPRPVDPAPAAGADDEGEGRKRRRRGRRGGRGRRRSAGGAPEGAEMTPGAPTLNGDDMHGFDDAAGSHESPDYAESAPTAYEADFDTATPSHVPPPAAPDAGVTEWAPAGMSARPEHEIEPAHAARDTMSPDLPAAGARPSRVDRGERHHRARPESTPDMNVDELTSTSRRLTEELLRAMGFEPKVSVRAEGNRVDVTIEVDRDDDLLNGREGETRQALQHLLNRFLNKGDGSRYHLQLEINDHWQQRETQLAELAHRLADEAASRQVEVVSDLLNSQERRIVHMTLREDARVKTYSLGDGTVKRVAVAPAGFPDRSEDDPAS